MTRRALTVVGAGCAVALVVAGAFALLAAFHRAATELAPANRTATAFATIVGGGDDTRAYGMMCPETQRAHAQGEFCAQAAEARKTLGGFRAEPPPAAASANLQVRDDEWRCSTTLLLRGENARGMASVDLVREGCGPWRVRNWSWARADAR